MSITKCSSLILLLLLSNLTFASIRSEVFLEKNWLFIKRDGVVENTIPQSSAPWEKISVPHTFNVSDAADGGGYYRGPSWYKTTFIAGELKGKRTFIEFGGAALRADVYVNDVHVGHHDGGYSRFRFDISNYLKRGKNNLSVRVDNSRFEGMAPLGGDFSVYGGLYRYVKLIKTSPVHIDLLDYASDGVYVHMKDVSAQEARADLDVLIRNDIAAQANIGLVAELINNEGEIVQASSENISLEGNGSKTVKTSLHILKPHLWNGVIDPYLYTLRVKVLVDKKVKDQILQRIGFRKIEFDSKAGLRLNGKPYKVYGVNTHLTQRPLKGTAVSEADIKEDLEILDDIGLTGIRLAHYQHPHYIFDHADEKGYLIWAEVPLVSEVNASEAFIDNAKQQLRELIRQNYNHPSVFVWGIGNEIYNANADSNKVLEIIHKEAVAEDSSRPTVYANCCGSVSAPIASHAELNASNVYNGWYKEQVGSLLDWARQAKGLIPNRSLAISEYGAGASIYHHEIPPKQPETAGPWHPEEYQTLVHKAAWRDIRKLDFLWASFIWVAFDFASDGRSEGDHNGINDKGLVTFDRKVKKDTFYWYQANWSKKPMIHLESSRYSHRKDRVIDLTATSNLPVVKLYINGKLFSENKVIDHEATWSGVTLKPGENVIKVTSTNGKISNKISIFFDPTE